MTFCRSGIFIFTLFLALLFPSFAVGKYGGGIGSADDPFLIFNPTHLSQIGNNPDDWDKYFKLMADVDMKDFNGQPGFKLFPVIGYFRWEPYDSKPFKGVFDGNRKKIINLTIPPKNHDFVGLFGYVQGPSACIKNLIVVNPIIMAGNAMYVGAIAGKLRSGTIIDCTVDKATVSGGDCVGGLTGYNAAGVIRNCTVSASVSGKTDVGGITGYHAGAQLSRCKFSGKVYGSDDVGGIAGESDSKLEFCGADASVFAEQDKVAGLVGTLRGPANCCFAKGTVAGDNEVGGLVGRNTGFIQNCYARNSVVGNTYVGGLTGLLYDVGKISRSYTVCTIDADSNEAGQFIGWGRQSEITASFWPKNDSDLIQMRQMDSYVAAGWDFVAESNNGSQDLWDICDGSGFPILSWQGFAPGDFNCPEGVDINDIILLVEQWLKTSTGMDIAGGVGDYIVNFRDLSVFAGAWRTKAGQPAYDLACDLLPDGLINILDLSVLAENWLLTGINASDISDPKGNGIIDFTDWAAFAGAWKSRFGQANWNVKCDAVPDGVIDIDDLAVFADQWLVSGAGFADIAPVRSTPYGIGSGDGVVNLLDFALAAQSYLEQD